MGLLGLVRETLGALQKEDELHLAFIFGFRVDSNKFREAKKLLSEGVFLRSLIFFKQTFSRLTPGSRVDSPITYLLYAGTDNQFKTLLATANALDGETQPYSFVCDRGVNQSVPGMKANIDAVSFSLVEALAATVVYCLRAPSLLRKLSAAKNTVGRRKYFDKFTQAYIYIPYFHQLLRRRKPSFVIMSNDHNTENRCLRLSAERLGIKTVFMQHGSGNAMLPPLDFDYAFLDGCESVEKYIQCAEKARQEGQAVASQNTTIFLGGSKHAITANRKPASDLVFGVAINPHDELDAVSSLLLSLSDKGIACRVRAHPTQEKADVFALNALAENTAQLSISVYGQESTDDFLAQCSALIAGNSSIHLEAALARVPTYYFQFGDKSGLPFDYLHHVRGGVAAVFPTDYSQHDYNFFRSLAEAPVETLEKVRQFSESFGTHWEGKEGELVVQTLMQLSTDAPELSGLYTASDDTRGYRAIFRLPKT